MPPGSTAAAAVAVRINDAASAAFNDDLRLVARRVAAVVVPKPSAPTLRARPRRRAGRTTLLPLIETAGIARARDRAPGVSGSRSARSTCARSASKATAMAARLRSSSCSRRACRARRASRRRQHRDDDAGRSTPTRGARRLGFGAKLCIHPRQIAAVHAAFAPSADELAWAERVVAATQRAGGGAVAVDGRMVDRPVLLRAQALLARAR
jgi:citrate lyase subunit beta/citryl-CoA lyase